MAAGYEDSGLLREALIASSVAVRHRPVFIVYSQGIEYGIQPHTVTPGDPTQPQVGGRGGGDVPTGKSSGPSPWMTIRMQRI